MQLRNYQSAAFQATINWLKYKDTPAIIVIPTGGGKTIVIKYLIEHYAAQGKRILLLAHRKELLTQSGEKLDVEFSYWSKSLKDAKDQSLGAQVTVAGIQSIYNKETPPYDIILVDECHRISNSKEGQYWTLIEKHPQARLIGLTASPHRLKGGALDWGNIIFNIGYAPLIDEGYLCSPTNKVSTTPDLSNVSIKMGDYTDDELESVMLDPELIRVSVAKIKQYGETRNSVLIFCVSIKHSELLQEVLALNDIASKVVTGKTPLDKRDAIIEQFKNGEIKYLINVELLLEGFDMPSLDAIVCLRPTQSMVLWQQMIGRGVRIHEGKKDFLILDMAGNLRDHGGLGNPIKEKAKKEFKREIGRVCPVCEEFIEGSKISECKCGYQFPPSESPLVSHNHNPDTSSKTIYTGEIETYDVTGVSYRQHKSKKGALSIRIDYHSPSVKYGAISDYLSAWHESDWVRNKVSVMFKERGHPLASDPKSYTAEDLLWHCALMKQPTQIVVDHSEKYPRIKQYIYGDKKTEPVVQSLDEMLDSDRIEF